MEILLGIIGMIAVAAVVGVTAYFMLKSSNEKELKKLVLEQKKGNASVITPIRLQSYERLALLLERIKPESLLLREMAVNRNVGQYHSMLLSVIRNEFEHNLSQQVYVSPDMWKAIRKAKEEIVKIINLAAGQLEPDAPGSLLATRILEMTSQLAVSPSDQALDVLHNEVQSLY